MNVEDPEHPNDDEDDLRPTAEHEALIIGELICIRRTLAVSVQTTGIPPEGHVVIVADLRGLFGRQVGEAVVGEPIVERALRMSLATGRRPSISAPLPIHEAMPILAMVGQDAVERVMTRPPRSISLLVVDEHDNPAVAIVELGPTDEGRGRPS